jgi:hypothetical protein
VAARRNCTPGSWLQVLGPATQPAEWHHPSVAWRADRLEVSGVASLPADGAVQRCTVCARQSLGPRYQPAGWHHTRVARLADYLAVSRAVTVYLAAPLTGCLWSWPQLLGREHEPAEWRHPGSARLTGFVDVSCGGGGCGQEPCCAIMPSCHHAVVAAGTWTCPTTSWRAPSQRRSALPLTCSEWR